jgi:outer membrane protein
MRDSEGGTLNKRNKPMSFKNIQYKIRLFVLFFGISFISQSQELLTLDSAVVTALRQSYGIEIAKMQEKVADMQIFKGNAGMMPRVDWNTNLGTALNQVSQKFTDGRAINRFGYAFAPVTNLAFSWTLYDGNRMYAVMDRLRSQSQATQIQTKLLMENTILTVMGAYYEVMRQKQTVKYLETVIKYYNERLKLTEERWEFGKGSKLDFLQSKTDLVTQQVEMTRAKNALKNAKINLNNAMNREADVDFDVLDSIIMIYEPDLTELKNQTRLNNKELLALRKNRDISIIQQKEAEALKKPRITLNSTFGYNLNRTNAGLFLLNQNIGLNTGVAATWNIFNGEITRRQIQTAKINTDILQKQQNELVNNIETDLIVAFNQYQSDKELLILEEENIKVVEENLQISLEKFKLGGSTILELNEAQRRFDLASNRLVNARFNVKNSELALMRLSGDLVK